MADGSDSGVARGTKKAAADLVNIKEEDERDLSQTVPLNTAQKLSHVEDAGNSNEMGDDDEQKPKLALELKYRSFSNFNRCLCVVVEPWPPLRRASDTHAASLPSSAAARQSSRPPTHSESRDQRGKTPLFLPDIDDERATPSALQGQDLPPAPLFDNSQADRDIGKTLDLGAGIMQFSQLLNTTGRVTGAVEEDDEFDGAALFADADEAKEL